MPIQAIDTDRLYRKIAQQLSDLMAAGELAPGERLPAERELAQQLGVSRPSVREALIALEIAGKVEVRVGSGVFVSARPASLALMSEEGEGPFELIKARRVVEGETAAGAAEEATAEELAVIRAAVEEMQEHSAGDPATDGADRSFHLAVARATHNGPLAAVVQLLWDRGRGAIWKQMERHFQTPALRAASLRDHRAILSAIEARNPRVARRAMRTHLARVGREFGRGWETARARREAAAHERAAATPLNSLRRPAR